MKWLRGIAFAAIALSILHVGAAYAQRTQDAPADSQISDAASAGVYQNLQHLLQSMNAARTDKTAISSEEHRYGQLLSPQTANPCASHAPSDWQVCLASGRAQLRQARINDDARNSLDQQMAGLAQSISHSSADADRAAQRAALAHAADFLARSAHHSP